ncbi:hypothetical protein [Streptomyces profundus]|uniref:hypothetical protein n=1 Tax=Streptomyces profundus TaxID=2867410 RepID=UPI001D163A5B|nr:hypothetical protein [Streptomyces sp. MA3_2.13]UED87347.1 hypothetical protein K4G22_26635 [Streptomyces sp. MA3_2.13]
MADEEKEPVGLPGVGAASPRWHRWRDLHNEGTLLLQDGRPHHARSPLAAAYAETQVQDVDEEGLLHRATTATNMAGVAEAEGDLAEAERLITESVELSAGLGGYAGAQATLVNSLVSRAQLAMSTGRPTAADADLARAFAVADELPEPGDLLAFTLHGARTTLWMVTGELAEAEQEALIALDIALAFRPELAVYPCDNLARIALACDNPEAAEEFRRIAEDPALTAEEWGTADGIVMVGADDGAPDPAVLAPGSRAELAPWPLGPRWRRSVALNLEGVRHVATHQLAEADGLFQAAERATRTVGGGLDALFCRANVLINRTGIASTRGDAEGALGFAEEAVEALVTVVTAVGADHGAAAVLAQARQLRAAMLRELGRHAEALAELARVEELLPSLGAGRHAAEVWWRLLRTTLLMVTGRFAEAADEGERALALAQEHAPWLAPRAYVMLAEQASGIGDNETSATRLRLARELFAALGETEGEVATLVSLGRLDYLAERPEEARRHYDAAEALLPPEGAAQMRAACRHGRAAVAVSSGRAEEGLALLRQALDEWGEGRTPLVEIAFHQVAGSAHAALDNHAEAERCLLTARRLGQDHYGWHLALTVDWWRAHTHINWAADLADEAQRAPLLDTALDLAVPAALAAEAARQFFTAGVARERWVALAAAPATRAALLAIRSLGDAALGVALLDHLAATVSLRLHEPAASVPSAGPPDVLTVPLPTPAPLTNDQLSYAAAGLGLVSTGDEAFPAPQLALPPRVRVATEVPSPLEPWIERAEERYGFPIRSAEVVRAW